MPIIHVYTPTPYGNERVGGFSYIVSTVVFSSGVDQFRGHASWIWYPHVPFVTFQKATFGSTVAGNSVMIGLNDQAPIKLSIMREKGSVVKRTLDSSIRNKQRMITDLQLSGVVRLHLRTTAGIDLASEARLSGELAC